MDRAALRALQAPVREAYAADPAAALTELSRSADWRDEGVTTTFDGWGGTVRAGLHPATGGTGEDACSGDLLLEAVLACAGVTMRSVATAMGLQVHRATLTARTRFDARGTLGMSREVPVGCDRVEVRAELDCDADDATLARLAASTERYCVVGQTLREPPLVTVVRAG